MKDKEINLILRRIELKNRIADVLGSEKIRQCAEYWRKYLCGKCGVQELETYLCHDRFCPYCQRFRAAKNAARLRKFLDSYNARGGLRFLTLTVKNIPWLRKKDLVNLRRCYTNLRYRLKRSGIGFYGGCYSIETTWSESGYHPHIHAIIDSDFIDHSYLSRLWLDITGNSFVVGINRVKDGSENELCKYLCKVEEFPDNHLLNYYNITKRMRLIQSTGWKLNLIEEKEKTAIKSCQCGGLLDLLGMVKIEDLLYRIS